MNLGVVERGVEPAELGDGAVSHRGHLGVVAHITTDRECFATNRRPTSAPPPSPCLL
jgi:hypothetical protein